MTIISDHWPHGGLHMAIDVIDCYGQHEVMIGTIMGLMLLTYGLMLLTSNMIAILHMGLL